MKLFAMNVYKEKTILNYMNKRFFSSLGVVLASMVVAVSAYAQAAGRSMPPPAAVAPSASLSAAENRSLADYIVAIVQREPITHAQVLAHMMSIKHQNAGQQMPSDEHLYQMALQQLISQSALAQRANQLGMRIDAQALNTAVSTIASSNNMTVAQLQQSMESAGIPFATFRRSIEQQLLMMQLRERTLDPTITVSNAEVDAYLGAQHKDPGQQMINLAQILIAVPENATDAQVRVLEAKAQDVYKQLQNGKTDFFALVDQYSNDQNKAVSRGVMGARPISAYPDLFVNAVVNLRAGDVSAPVRSGAGFHIIKVLEREQSNMMAVTQTHVRHILLNINEQNPEQAVIEHLQSERNKIETGQVSFEVLAREISQDASAKDGGNLGWVVPGMFVPEFERVMERLKPGEISQPVVTRFGVHLIQVLERREAQLTAVQQREIARETLHQAKVEQAVEQWARDIQSRAYIELREPPR